jgi:hypothetical protein
MVISGVRKAEPETEKVRTSIWSRNSCKRLSSFASVLGKYGHRLSPPAAQYISPFRDSVQGWLSCVIPCRSSRQRSSRSPPCAFSLSFKQSCFREPRLTKRVSGHPLSASVLEPTDWYFRFPPSPVSSHGVG